MYDAGRYFTVTGRVCGATRTVEERTAALSELHADLARQRDALNDGQRQPERRRIVERGARGESDEGELQSAPRLNQTTSRKQRCRNYDDLSSGSGAKLPNAELSLTQGSKRIESGRPRRWHICGYERDAHQQNGRRRKRCEIRRRHAVQQTRHDA